MRVGRNRAHNLHATKTVDVGGVDEGEVHVAGVGVRADVAHAGAFGHEARKRRAVKSAALAVGLRARGALFVNPAADRGESLLGIVAGGNVVVAHGHGVLAGRHVVKRDLRDIRVFARHDDQVIREHVEASAFVDVGLFDRRVHSALGRSDQDVGIRSGSKHFVQRAGRFVLSVSERDALVSLAVELLDFVHSLGQRIRCKDLQLDGFGSLGRGLFGARSRTAGAFRRALFRRVGRAARQREHAHQGKRQHCRDHEAKVLLHIIPPRIGFPP